MRVCYDNMVATNGTQYDTYNVTEFTRIYQNLNTRIFHRVHIIVTAVANNETIIVVVAS